MSEQVIEPAYNAPLAAAILKALHGARYERATFDASEGRLCILVDVPGELRSVKVVVAAGMFSYAIAVFPGTGGRGLNASERSRAALFLSELNQRIQKGEFAIDSESGLLCFRTIVDADGFIPSAPVVALSVARAIETTLRYAGALRRALRERSFSSRL